jgi:hypothetical protein
VAKRVAKSTSLWSVPPTGRNKAGQKAITTPGSNESSGDDEEKGTIYEAPRRVAKFATTGTDESIEGDVNGAICTPCGSGMLPPDLFLQQVRKTRHQAIKIILTLLSKTNSFQVKISGSESSGRSLCRLQPQAVTHKLPTKETIVV